MMDKATIGQEVEYHGVTRLDNYMMDKVCELNPMLTKSHTPPIRMYSLCIRGWAYGLIINL